MDHAVETANGEALEDALAYQAVPRSPSCTFGSEAEALDAGDDHDDGEEEEDGQANYLSLDTKATKFEVVTPRDLNSGNKFRNAEAWTFRNKMLNDPRRVRREDHRSKRVQLAKRAAGGKDVFVRAAATT